MTMAYATVTGRIVVPGTTTGIPGQVTATPLTSNGVLVFPAEDYTTVGPAVADVDPDGTLNPDLKIPTDVPEGTLWRLKFHPKGKGKLPVHLGDYEITAAADIADLVNVSVTAITPTVAADIAGAQAAALEAKGYRDEARDLSNIDTPDALVANLLSNPASATGVAASATIGTAVEAGKGEYTIAIIPDTQYLPESWPAHFQALADFLTANKDALNLKLIAHVGDVVNKGNATQYNAAAGPMHDIYDIGVPAISVVGNHDIDGAYDPSPTTGWDATTLWNTHFGTSLYTSKPWFDGGFMQAGRSDNMYLRTTLGGRPTLVIGLEWGPRKTTMQWADGVVAANPGYDIIVITHSWLDWNGNQDIAYPGMSYGPYRDQAGTRGADLNWTEHMRAWPGLVGVFNGHYFTTPAIPLATRTDVGDAGNAVFQQFNNWQEHTQGGQGRVVLLTVNPETRTARRRVYNPALGAYDTTAGNEAVIRLGDTAPRTALDRLYAGAPSTLAAGLTIGTGGALVTTPHKPDLNVSALDIRARATMATWVGLTNGSLFIDKWLSPSAKGYSFGIGTSGELMLYYSVDGTTTGVALSNGSVPFAPGATGWVRATRDTGTGTITFYYSSDYEPGVNTGTWTQVGTPQAGTAGSLYANTQPANIGTRFGAGMTIHDVELRSTASTALVASARFDKQWTTHTDDAGHTWSLTGSGSAWIGAPRPIDLATRIKGLAGQASLDFPSVAAAGSQELTIAVPGAAVGDTVYVGAPSTIAAGLVWNGYVSAANTVKVRVTNVTAAAIDPAAATWKVRVVK